METKSVEIPTEFIKKFNETYSSQSKIENKIFKPINYFFDSFNYEDS